MTAQNAWTEIFGRSLLEHQLQTLGASGIEDITVVGGYLNEKLQGFGEKVIINENYGNEQYGSLTVLCIILV